MTDKVRQRLALALLLSLLLHLSLLIAPGWYLPESDDTLAAESSSVLEAHLASVPVPQAAAPSVHSTTPRRRHSVPLVPASPTPVAEVPQIEQPPALPPNAGVPPSDSTRVPPPNSAGALPPEAPPSNEIAPVAVAPEVPAEAVAPAAPPTPESALPRQGQIRFVISRGDQGFVIGQSLHRWSHDGKRYKLSSVTETTGIAALFKPARVMQSSEGEIGTTGLRPSEFLTEKNGVAGDAASFDWTGLKLKLSGGSQRELPLVAGAQDMLSMFYQISALFPWTPSEFNQIMVATGRKFERYTFEVLREETLATKYGDMRTLHLHTAAGIEAIDIWSALDLHGLPLKIRYTDRQGESFDQTAEDIEFDGMPASTRKQ